MGKHSRDVYTSGISGQTKTEVKNRINRSRSGERGLDWERKCEEEWRLKEKTGWWEEEKKKQIGRRERKTSLCRGEEEAGGGGVGAEKETWKHRRKQHKKEESRVLVGVKTATWKTSEGKKTHKKSTFQLLMSYRSRRHSADLQHVNIWRIIGV